MQQGLLHELCFSFNNILLSEQFFSKFTLKDSKVKFSLLLCARFYII